ncbi:MAG TPA: spore germination protein GerW family protein [Mycobacteriales bacterium]|nr:spore germination protein GerW family protein [Mycobacteriales bacterium]
MSEGIGLVDRMREVATVRRSFGEPMRQDGTVVIPVASVAGGGGAGSDSAEGDRPGGGGGFGLSVVPSGVFVLRDGGVRWQPAVDVNRLVLGGQIVAVTALLTIRSLARRRSGRMRH